MCANSPPRPWAEQVRWLHGDSGGGAGNGRDGVNLSRTHKEPLPLSQPRPASEASWICCFLVPTLKTLCTKCHCSLFDFLSTY